VCDRAELPKPANNFAQRRKKSCIQHCLDTASRFDTLSYGSGSFYIPRQPQQFLAPVFKKACFLLPKSVLNKHVVVFFMKDVTPIFY